MISLTSVFSLKTILISSAVVGVVAFSGGFSAAWKWQKYSYDKIIADKEAAGKQFIAQHNNELINKERKQNEELANKNVLIIEQGKRIDSLRADNDKLYRQLGGMFVKSSGCVSKTSDASSTSGIASDKTGYCRLSDDVAERLSDGAYKASKLAQYAEVCHNYAEEVNKWIIDRTKEETLQKEDDPR